MCLYSKTKEPKISTQKIKGYKLAFKRYKRNFDREILDDFIYSSPVVGAYLPVGTEIIAKGKDYPIWLDKYNGEENYCIKEQGIHIFKNREDAELYKNEFLKIHKNREFVILEATIGENVEYWEGEQNILIRDFKNHVYNYKKVEVIASKSIVLSGVLE